jgi:hypothetical protein
MKNDILYEPPTVTTDARTANELSRLALPEASRRWESERAAADRFNGYKRSLTARGGLQFTYGGQAANGILDVLRWSGWLLASGIEARLIADSKFGPVTCFLLFLVAALLTAALVFRKIRVMHSIEIHP